MRRRLTCMRILWVAGILLILLATLVNLAACGSTQRTGTLQLSLNDKLELNITGAGFAPGESVKLVISEVAPGVDLTLTQFEADSAGAFSVVESKRTPNLIKKGATGAKPMAPGNYTVSAIGSEGSTATATVTVPAQ